MPQFENAYQHQLAGFYTELKPTPLKGARLLYHSEPLARELGLDESWFTQDKSSAFGPGSWGMAGAFCWVNNAWRMAAAWTGT